MEFSTLTGTQIIAIWGALTGTIGTITGIIGLWLRFRSQKRDQARLKCEAIFDFEVSDGVPRPKYKIVVRCIGRRPVTLDCIEYYYNPKSLKDRLVRRYLWCKGQWSSKDEVGGHPPANLIEGQKKVFLIKSFRLDSLEQILKVSVIDQTGRSWPVNWPSSRTLKQTISHGELDRIKEENSRHSLKIVGYFMGSKFYILTQWNKEPSNKSSFTSRTFHFKNKNTYNLKLEDLRDVQLPKFLSGEISQIT